MLNRAYATLEIKSVDEERRHLSGIASTPTPDRMGDIVVPEGAQFDLPLPLLWHHDSKSPVGHVVKADVTSKGIEVVAELAKVDEPGKLKDRIDEAWQSIKSGLVRGLSIGFRSIEHEPIIDEAAAKADPWAAMFAPRKHLKWLWLELSAVTIPANGEATITAIKSIDRAALGIKTSVALNPPGVAGKSSKASEMGIHEQIVALDKTRDEKSARMGAIMQKVGDEGRSTDEAEREEFDTLQREIETLDGDLKRLKQLEAVQAASVRPVQGNNGRDASASRSAAEPIIVRNVKPKAKDGIPLARVVRCLGLAQGNRWGAAEIAERIYKHDPDVANVLKATVVAGSTSTATGAWGGELVGDETGTFADFIEYLRPRTIVGRFGNNGIPSLRRVPFRVPLVGQTGGGQGYWVGEAKAKPLTSFDFERRTLEPLKVAAITVATMELLRDSSPSAEGILRDQLVQACQARIDTDFINPDKAASAGVSPASILNGVTAIISTGSSADNIRADVKALLQAYIDANNPPTSAVWIMSAGTAVSLQLMTNPLGQPEFPNIDMSGGTFMGFPVITSEFITVGTSGDFVALVNAQDIYFADEGDFQVDMSNEASLEMSDTPTGASGPTAVTANSLVSMFQTNSVAFRAERTLNWMRRRDTSVAWLTNVDWGALTT